MHECDKAEVIDDMKINLRILQKISNKLSNKITRLEVITGVIIGENAFIIALLVKIIFFNK